MPYPLVDAVGEKIRLLYEEALEALDAFAEEDACSSGDVLEWVKSKYPSEFDIAERSFITGMSQIAKTNRTNVISAGRKRGYYISKYLPSIEEETEPTQVEQNVATKRKEKEKVLYPLLSQWLREQQYNAKDTSSGTIMGKWGNPDITGIKAVEVLGTSFLNIATIEAKISFTDWQYWFFEAVSHRRFANRAYFAFAHPEEGLLKISPDLRYYSELYGVGVLVLPLPNDVFIELTKGNISSEDLEERGGFTELYSAPYFSVVPEQQARFVSTGLKIDSQKALWNWGDEPISLD